MMSEMAVGSPEGKSQVGQQDEAQANCLTSGHVDMTTVKDLRKVLRRKFASRANLDKIFAQWDLGNKGEISTVDLTNGIKKLGISVTHE